MTTQEAGPRCLQGVGVRTGEGLRGVLAGSEGTAPQAGRVAQSCTNIHICKRCQKALFQVDSLEFNLACLPVGGGAFPLGLEMEEGVGSHHSVSWGYGML